MDPEMIHAWHRLKKEVGENVPILAHGLAKSGKRLPRKLYSATVRGCKSLISNIRGWDFSPSGRKALVAQLSRVRLRSPIYKV